MVNDRHIFILITPVILVVFVRCGHIIRVVGTTAGMNITEFGGTVVLIATVPFLLIGVAGKAACGRIDDLGDVIFLTAAVIGRGITDKEKGSIRPHIVTDIRLTLSCADMIIPAFGGYIGRTSRHGLLKGGIFNPVECCGFGDFAGPLFIAQHSIGIPDVSSQPFLTLLAIVIAGQGQHPWGISVNAIGFLDFFDIAVGRAAAKVRDKVLRIK